MIKQWKPRDQLDEPYIEKATEHITEHITDHITDPIQNGWISINNVDVSTVGCWSKTIRKHEQKQPYVDHR